MMYPVSRWGTLMVASSLVLVGCSNSSSTDRQGEVRSAGAAVMPFDLDETKHTFTKTEDGGVQTVFALDPSDQEQIARIRSHFRELQMEFSSGDFSRPAAIHGKSMPGLVGLVDNASSLRTTYEEIPAGASLTYQTDSGQVVGFLHEWFDAQVSDHGTDVVEEPMGHVMTEEMWKLHHPGEPYPGPDGHK